MTEPKDAGHMPCPRGILMRASTRPYCAVNFPEAFSRAEVYWQVVDVAADRLTPV